MAAAIQLQQFQATPSPASSYDLFSKGGHACCAKLENDSVEVFEEDESTSEVTVSWSNGLPCCLSTTRGPGESNPSPDADGTIESSTFTNGVSLDQTLNRIENARLKVM